MGDERSREQGADASEAAVLITDHGPRIKRDVAADANVDSLRCFAASLFRRGILGPQKLEFGPQAFHTLCRIVLPYFRGRRLLLGLIQGLAGSSHLRFGDLHGVGGRRCLLRGSLPDYRSIGEHLFGKLEPPGHMRRIGVERAGLSGIGGSERRHRAAPIAREDPSLVGGDRHPCADVGKRSGLSLQRSVVLPELYPSIAAGSYQPPVAQPSHPFHAARMGLPGLQLRRLLRVPEPQRPVLRHRRQHAAIGPPRYGGDRQRVALERAKLAATTLLPAKYVAGAIARGQQVSLR